MTGMNWAAFAATVGTIAAAAVLGKVLIPKSALDWFRGLRWPVWLVPYKVFIAVGIVYYFLMAVVLYRAVDRGDIPAVVWSAVVIAGNEAWNVLFFGMRSTLAGFLGILGFAVPLAGLIFAAGDDALSVWLAGAYGLWVVYDIAWTFALWRMNRRSSFAVPGGHGA